VAALHKIGTIPRELSGVWSRLILRGMVSQAKFGDAMEHVKLGVHIWVSVLIMGTLWRILSYHLIASGNTNLQHLGRAMAQQY
jgi:hypothetical protein